MDRVIFWDSDGTLLPKNESFKESLIRAFRLNSLSVSDADAQQCMKAVCTWHHPERSFTDKTGESWWRFLLSGIKSFCIERHLPETAADNICTAFRECVLAYPHKLYDDTENVLRYFSEKGYTNCILSNNYPELWLVYIALGIDKYIAEYFISANIGYEKPRKELFDYALKQCGYPETCYMVGDNPVADIEGARNAGIPAILVHSGVTLSDLKDIIK